MPKNLNKLSIIELREMWQQAWNIRPNVRIGRAMLEKSLKYKLQEQKGLGLNSSQLNRLEKLVKTYKKYPKRFDNAHVNLKEGTQLNRIWKGKKHIVIVKSTGFEYRGEIYSSLSKIANIITNKKWNGWVFFGLKKKVENS